MIRILQGDCRDVLKTLPDASVQCCVTSPPYFGLRDYGTASWEGGDPECQHIVGGQVQDNKAPGAIQTGVRPGVDASRCKRCGARRVDQQIGLEPTPDEYVAQLVAVFREVRRVLRDDGTLWLNLGDSFASKPAGSNGFHDGRANREERTSCGIPLGLKPKDLIGIPWRVAFALQADGWYLRSDIIWSKPNPMPESVRDRPTKAHEYVFLLSKNARYFWDAEAVREPMAAASIERLSQDIESQAGSLRANGGAKTNGPMRAVAKGNAKTFRGGGAYTGGQSFDNSACVPRDSVGNAPNPTDGRNARSVWTIATQPFSEAHFATMPPDLAERCIKAGTRPGDTVLDPFGGAGTTGLVADRLQRDAILIELNPNYADMARGRMTRDAPLFAEVTA